MITQSYDLDADALYIELADHQVARTAQVDAGTLVDLDATGNVVGIEVIRPDRSWPLDAILREFTITPQDARELRAYFPHPVGIVPPAHPAARVPVAVGLQERTESVDRATQTGGSTRLASEQLPQVCPYAGHTLRQLCSFR